MTHTTQRAFEHKVLWYATPAGDAAACQLLADAADREYGPITAVVGIARGGTLPAGRVAAALGAPMFQALARHNTTDAPYAPATGQVDCDLAGLPDLLRPNALAGTVLLVDDIYGTGATLTTLAAHLHPLLAPEATLRTATLCLNLGAPARPDLYCWAVADWVTFPWEHPLPTGGAPIQTLPLPTEAVVVRDEHAGPGWRRILPGNRQRSEQ